MGCYGAFCQEALKVVALLKKYGKLDKILRHVKPAARGTR